MGGLIDATTAAPPAWVAAMHQRACRGGGIKTITGKGRDQQPITVVIIPVLPDDELLWPALTSTREVWLIYSGIVTIPQLGAC
jgi:hypothetical protein